MKHEFLGVISWLFLAMSAGAMTISDLRCEYRVNPLGLDAVHPRLSWKLEETGAGKEKRGLSQTAYQVLVASTAERLAKDQGDWWDSGKVASDQSIHIEYAGKALGSGVVCHWKIRAWDQEGKPSAWSQPAIWTMGLLKPEDWQAKWIGRDEEAGASSNLLTSARWIWFPEGEPAASAPVGMRYFRRVITLPADRKITKAVCQMTADNSFELFINGKKAGSGSNFNAAPAMDLKECLRAGDNVIAVAAANVGETPNPAGLIGTLRVEFDRGEPLVLVTDGKCKTNQEKREGWESAKFDDAGWAAAKDLGAYGIAPWGKPNSADESRRLAARYLRQEFKADKKIARATAYVCGLGLFELRLNGEKVGDHVLEPALTEYDRRCCYLTFDVTKQIRNGSNAVGVILGNGRFWAMRTNDPTFMRNFGCPRLCLQMVIEYADGSRALVASDETWRLTDQGPIRANNEYDGEEYDARMEMTGWDQPGFNDRTWTPAQLVKAPAGMLAVQTSEPIRVTETLKPVAVTSPQPGVYIFDLGQNMVGWCRLKVKGPAGTTVSLHHAETLKPDGTLYVANLRSARTTDLYTLKGGGVEVYEPRFTYHGFRYVEVTGYPGKLDLTAIEGHVVHDDLQRAGEFVCSSELLNQIAHNIFWGVRGNYRSIVTDCPQRDERQGWLGDRSAEAGGEAYLFNIAPIYSKWLTDIADAQRADGCISDVCPAYWPFYNGNVTWPSLEIIVPGTLYDEYGDRRVVEQTYPTMKRWMEFIGRTVKDGITSVDNYGDWCVPPEAPGLIHSNDPSRRTAGPVLATSYHCHNLRLMARYATILGKNDEAQQFGKAADEIQAAFNRQFFKSDQDQYDNGSQTSYVLPLAFGMVPPEHRQPVFERLVDKIVKQTPGMIGTGLIGGQWLMRTLGDYGRSDVAYAMASRKEYPSWGYMVSKGATTVWELWNGNTADPAMNSGNHVMLIGDLYIWMNRYLGGIRFDPDRPGYKHIIIRPTPVTDLAFVRTTHESPYGRIVSNWKYDGQKLTMEVTIPVNTTATVYVPTKEAALVTESGKPVAQAAGVKFLGLENGEASYQVGSGEYRFEVGTK